MRLDIKLELYGKIVSDEVLEEIVDEFANRLDSDGRGYGTIEETLASVEKSASEGNPLTVTWKATYDDFETLKSTAKFGGLAYRYYTAPEDGNHYSEMTTFNPVTGKETWVALSDNETPVVELSELKRMRLDGMSIDEIIAAVEHRTELGVPKRVEIDPEAIKAYRTRLSNAPAP